MEHPALFQNSAGHCKAFSLRLVGSRESGRQPTGEIVRFADRMLAEDDVSGETFEVRNHTFTDRDGANWRLIEHAIVKQYVFTRTKGTPESRFAEQRPSTDAINAVIRSDVVNWYEVTDESSDTPTIAILFLRAEDVKAVEIRLFNLVAGFDVAVSAIT